MSNGAHTYDRDPLKDRLSRIARFDGISSIVGQMMSNPQNERVQRLGCFSLAEVSYRNWDYTIKSAITRGAAAVVMAMQNHPDSAGLQHWGCAALASMSQGSEDGRRIVVHEGGAAVVASAIAKFPDNAEIQGWGNEMLQCAHHTQEGSAFGALEGPGRSFGVVLAQARERQMERQRCLMY